MLGFRLALATLVPSNSRAGAVSTIEVIGILGNWLPGAQRYRSFHALMQGEYESFLRLRHG